jgi:diguanylate cyclase (GGDEF)-like protein/PAS domain S-box-containing protein
MPDRRSQHLRITLFIALAVFSLVAAVQALLRLWVLPEYVERDNAAMLRNLARAHDALAISRRELVSCAADWAQWDDSYAFVAHRHAHYVEANLVDSTFINLRLNVLLIVDTEGRIVWGRGFDLTTNTMTPLPKGIEDHLAPDGLLMRPDQREKRFHGLLLLDERTLLFAKVPITRSSGEGPVRGAMIFGRYFDQPAVRALSSTIHVPLFSVRTDSRTLSPEIQSTLHRLSPESPTDIWMRDEVSMVGTTLLTDVYGKPAVILTTGNPRSFYQRGESTISIVLLVLLGMGVIITAILSWMVGLVQRGQAALQRREVRTQYERRFRELVSNLPDIILVHRDGRCLFVNDALTRVLGVAANVEAAQEVFAPLFEEEQVHTPATLTLQGEGDCEATLLVHATTTVLFGDEPASLTVLSDISELRHAQEELSASEAQYRLLAENASDVIWTTDIEGQCTYISPSVSVVLGHGPEVWIGGPMASLLTAHSAEITLQSVREVVAADARGECAPSYTWMLEQEAVCADGTTRWVESRMTLLRDHAGAMRGVLGVSRDITERKSAEERLNFLAYYDELTNLPNRFLFNDRLNSELAHLSRRDTRAAVIFLDLDRFKEVNDTLGHSTGDRLLREVAKRLQSCVRESDTVARMSGDEFVLLVPDLTEGRAGAEATAHRIMDAFTSPFVLEGQEIFVTPSLGITIAPDDGMTADQLMRNADMAMYRAKDMGRHTFQFFSNDLINALSERRTLEHHLRKAVEQNEFTLHYQPQVDLFDNKVFAVEALIRWVHPEFGTIPPGKFIPLAEETGLIESIGEWVLRTACAQMRAWRDEGYAELRVAVNISPRQFEQPDFTASVKRILLETGLPPQCLELEITESTAMKDPDHSLAVMQELRAHGVRIAIDDFGTGHCSFGYLKQYPVHTLKIDRSFIRDILDDKNDAEIVQAIIVLGRALGMSLVAECVETQGQAEALSAKGCVKFQGNLFSHPLPPEECVLALAQCGTASLEAASGV